ncbi:MAG: hypothetical protein AB7O32_19900 [Vicinamibacterales bacterium]
MFASQPRLWTLFTCLVALATMCALVLPEQSGGRDTFVRLTRTGQHRQLSPWASAHDVDEVTAGPETTVAPPGAEQLLSSTDLMPADRPPRPQVAPPRRDHGPVNALPAPMLRAGTSFPRTARAPPSL